MTRVVRNAALCIGGILLASAAFASTPDPTKSTLGNNIGGGVGDAANYVDVGGWSVFNSNGAGDAPACSNGPWGTGGTALGVCDSLPDRADATAPSFFTQYDIVIKRSDGTPIQGSNVTLDFSACEDIDISCNQVVTKSAQIRSAPNRVTKATDALGVATFNVIGYGNVALQAGNVTAPGHGAALADPGCVSVFADGTPLAGSTAARGPLKARVYDENGSGGSGTLGVGFAVQSSDAALCLSEAGKVNAANGCAACGGPLQARARTDFNKDHINTSADAGLLLGMAGRCGQGTGSRQTRSPGAPTARPARDACP